MLESTPRNWESIIEYFESYLVRAVLIKLNPNTFRLLGSSEFETVRHLLFSRIASVPNAVFVYEDILTGTVQSEWEEEYGPYPAQEILQSVLDWLQPYGLDVMPYKKNAEVTVLAQSFLQDTEKNLILRLYVPAGRIWSNEADRFLQLFRDYLANVAHLTVRLDHRRTNQGTIYEFHGDESGKDTQLQNEFGRFSELMDLCASNPVAAQQLLKTKELGRDDIIDIVSRYSKEAKRLQVDLKHERERKILSIRHRLESELTDVSPSQEDWLAISSLVEAALPRGIATSPMALFPEALLPFQSKFSSSGMTVNIRPQLIQNVNGVVAQEIYGNQHLTSEDHQLLALIREYGANKAKELEAAVHELSDQGAPQADRLGAKHRIKKFLIEVGKRTTDVGVGILQTYIEKQIGL